LVGELGGQKKRNGKKKKSWWVGGKLAEEEEGKYRRAMRKWYRKWNGKEMVTVEVLPGEDVGVQMHGQIMSVWVTQAKRVIMHGYTT
jgi:hypothetical protein